jgi:hypothetical protein
MLKMRLLLLDPLLAILVAQLCSVKLNLSNHFLVIFTSVDSCNEKLIHSVELFIPDLL